MIEIIDYKRKYRNNFKLLNEEWIKLHFVLEPHDIEVLDDPEKFILDDGGKVFFALDTETKQILGTVALVNVNEKGFEIAKMAVSPESRGKRIGKLLMIHALEVAQELKAQRVFLESNTKLEPAINLYLSFGFKEINLAEHPSPYSRANIVMEILYHYA